MVINIFSKHRYGSEAEILQMDILKAMDKQRTKPNRYEVWRTESPSTDDCITSTAFVYDRLDTKSISTVYDETGKVLEYRLDPIITAQASGTSRYDALRREIDDKLTVLNSSWQDGLDKKAFYSGVSGDNYICLYQWEQRGLADEKMTIDAFDFKEPPRYMQPLLYLRNVEWHQQHREAYQKMQQYYGDGGQQARFALFYAPSCRRIVTYLFDRCNPDFLCVRHDRKDRDHGGKKKAYWAEPIRYQTVSTVRPDEIEAIAREGILSDYKTGMFRSDEYGKFEPENAEIELIPFGEDSPCLFVDDKVMLELDAVNANMTFC